MAVTPGTARVIATFSLVSAVVLAGVIVAGVFRAKQDTAAVNRAINMNVNGVLLTDPDVHDILEYNPEDGETVGRTSTMAKVGWRAPDGHMHSDMVEEESFEGLIKGDHVDVYVNKETGEGAGEPWQVEAFSAGVIAALSGSGVVAFTLFIVGMRVGRKAWPAGTRQRRPSRRMKEPRAVLIDG